MGFITINDERLHTSVLNQNPVVSVRLISEELIYDIYYKHYEYHHKDGTVQKVTITSIMGGFCLKS